MNTVPARDIDRARSAQRKAETLDYVREMLRELSMMTAAENEQFVTYLINMAYVATSDLIRTRFANLVSDRKEDHGT